MHEISGARQSQGRHFLIVATIHATADDIQFPPHPIPIALFHAPISRRNIKVGVSRLRRKILSTDTRHLSIDTGRTGRRKKPAKMLAPRSRVTYFLLYRYGAKFLSTVRDRQLPRFGSYEYSPK